MKSPSEFSIFIVDDDPFFCNRFAEMMNKVGFRKIKIFNSYAEFIAKIVCKPDIILVDHHLNSMDGLETLKKIKRFDPTLLVIFISDRQDVEFAAEAFAAGAFEYMIKSQINEVKLQLIMDSMIELKTRARKNYKKTLLGRVISSMVIPIFVWLILQTFFK